MSESLVLLRCSFRKLQESVDRVEEALRSLAQPPARHGALELMAVDAADMSFYCTTGHPAITHSSAECPVCTLKRAIGYSEKWCDSCGGVPASA